MNKHDKPKPEPQSEKSPPRRLDWTVGHYGERCRDPKLCAGRNYCPRDPTCID